MRRADPAEPLCLALAAMGTRFELVLPEVPASAAAAARLRAVGEAALDEVRATEERWTRFRRDSFLAHVVATAHAAPVRLDEDDYELFDAARRVFELSGGAFDPCVAARSSAASDRGRAEPQCAGTFADVELDAEARTLRFRAPGLALDLGGIAKGHALDRAVRVLRDCGVRNALVHGGTSAVCALGSPAGALTPHAMPPTSSSATPPRAGWHVLLGAGEDAPEARLVDAALGVSAALGHRSTRATSHVIDPRRAFTRRGASERAAAANTALAASAIALALSADPAPLAFADALATALLVTGTALAPERLTAITQATKPRTAPWRVVAGPPLISTRATAPRQTTR